MIQTSTPRERASGNGIGPVATQTRPGRALVLAGATRLARAGRYDEARQTLDELGDTGRDVEVLDLLARMHAQQGRLADADRCWATAQEVDPEAPGARAGREGIAAVSSGRRDPWRRGGRWVALGVGGAVVLAAAAATGGWLGTRTVGPDGPGAPGSTADPGVRTTLDRLAQDQRRTADELAALRGGLDGGGPALRAALDGGPAAVREVPGGVRLMFPGALFSGGDTLTAGGRSALDDLARRLAAVPGRAAITVVGHVAGEPSGGEQDQDVDLGLQRATVAARELARATGRPLVDVGITSAGSSQPPYPGDPADARNRTVTVLVNGG